MPLCPACGHDMNEDLLCDICDGTGVITVEQYIELFGPFPDTIPPVAGLFGQDSVPPSDDIPF